MSEEKVRRRKLIEHYGQSVGSASAENLISEAVNNVGLDHKLEYTADEILKICNFLKKKEGYIKILSLIFISHVKLSYPDKEFS